MSIPELSALSFVQDEVTPVGHPVRLKVSSIHDAHHLCSGAQGGKLVRHEITVASNSSTSSRKPDDDDLLNGLPSKGVSHQLVDHVRHDVLPVEVEVGCLRRRLSVTCVLVAAAVRHPHLVPIMEGRVLLRQWRPDACRPPIWIWSRAFLELQRGTPSSSHLLVHSSRSWQAPPPWSPMSTLPLAVPS